MTNISTSSGSGKYPISLKQISYKLVVFVHSNFLNWTGYPISACYKFFNITPLFLFYTHFWYLPFPLHSHIQWRSRDALTVARQSSWQLPLQNFSPFSLSLSSNPHHNEPFFCVSLPLCLSSAVAFLLCKYLLFGAFVREGTNLSETSSSHCFLCSALSHPHIYKRKILFFFFDFRKQVVCQLYTTGTIRTPLFRQQNDESRFEYCNRLSTIRPNVVEGQAKNQRQKDE